jgi:calcipressin-1
MNNLNHDLNNLHITQAESVIDNNNNNNDENQRFIKLLRSYKTYLAKNTFQRRKQFSLDQDESDQAAMDCCELEDIEVNNNKDMLREIKSFISSNKKDSESEHEHHETELPKNLIVTSIPIDVFLEFDVKRKFEQIFKEIDPKCTFCYFRLLRRCSIEYDEGLSACLARYELENFRFLDENLKIFLTRPIRFKSSRTFLEPPENDKAFLISPPASPPVDWEQINEDPPVVNIELIAALSKLNPQEPCEIIKSQDDIPGIVIYPCVDQIETSSLYGNQKMKIIQTRRPNPNDF